MFSKLIKNGGLQFLLGLTLMWGSAEVSEWLSGIDIMLIQVLYSVLLLGGAFTAVKGAQTMMKALGEEDSSQE